MKHKMKTIAIITCVGSLSLSLGISGGSKTNSLDLRSEINRDLTAKMQQAFERYLPQVQLSDGYKLGFSKKHKLSPSILDGFLNWVLPAKDGLTVLEADNPANTEEINSHNGDIIVVGPAIEEGRTDTSQGLQEKLASNSGFQYWLDIDVKGRTKTLLIPFADVKRGHWVLFTLKNKGEENYSQFVDSKSKIPYFQAIAKRVKKAFLNAIELELENVRSLPSIYLGSQDMMDRTSCGFQAISMILQIAEHSEKACYMDRKPLVISTIYSHLKAKTSYADSLKDPFNVFIEEFTPRIDIDFDDDYEGTLSTELID